MEIEVFIMATYTNQDLSYNKHQTVKVYDPNGNFIDVIRDAPYLSGYKENINAAADTVRFTLPRPIDAYDGQYQPGSKDTIVLGNNVQWWLYGAGLPASGLLRYSGKIDTVTPKLDEQGGEVVEVVVTPYSQVLGDHAITSTVTFGTAGSSSTYIDTGQIFTAFFSGSYVDASGTRQTLADSITGQPYGYPYTLDPMSAAFTGNKVQFAFQNQNLLSVISNVLLLSPANYYVVMNQNQTVYLGQLLFTPQYTLRLGQHISTIEFPQDNVPRKNVAVLQGKGVQGKYTGSSVATLGQRVYFKSDNRIVDATTAQDLANGLGAVYDQTVIRAKIKIPDYRGDQQPGLGFDIEQFKVGQTLKVVDGRATPNSITGGGSLWGSMIWGRDKWGTNSPAPAVWGNFNWGATVWGANVGAIFNQVVSIQTIEYNYFSATLEVGFRSPTLNRKLYDLESRLNDATLVQ
jgi:hypothetical protein